MSKEVGCSYCQMHGNNSLRVIIDDIVCCVECKTDLSIPRWKIQFANDTLLELIGKLQEKGLILPSELTTISHAMVETWK